MSSEQPKEYITPTDEQLQISDIIKDLEQSLKFYKDRVNMLQCWQSSMRDPERKIVCDILANGFTLTTKEEVDNAEAVDASKAREEALALLEEWDYHNNRNFGKPHPLFADMIRLVREKPDEIREYVASLRSTQHTGQQQEGGR